MNSILEKINKPNDIKDISVEKYDNLAEEIRNFLIETVSRTGGHLASNLGTVDITIALHAVLDFPKDKIVWDVGHQSYTHKILTGRKGEFDKLRKYNGLSGFPKRNESACDAFDTGHSSTSISAALGIATADKLNNGNAKVVAVIGDGALTGGLAYEALNNVAALKRNFIIILNDNNMSISENVGGMSEYLNNIRIGQTYNDLKADIENSLSRIPKVGDTLVKKTKRVKDKIKHFFVSSGLFDDLGITYVGPVDGHDIKSMIKIFNDAKKLDHPILIHVMTKKGYGYEHAENNPMKFHGIDPFDLETGENTSCKDKMSYTDVFSDTIVELAKEDTDIVAITAAMPDGTGLSKFKNEFPDRFFDVGIAEEHAVTFAAGLAANGKKPFVSIYSSFYQRAYDQIIHDVCIPNLPVKMIIDRAGLVGRDGETHQGIFDMAFLSGIPNMTIIAPKNKAELVESIRYAKDFDGPIAIRFSRGEAYEGLDNGENSPIKIGKSEVLNKGKDVVIIAVGNMVEETNKAVHQLQKDGINPTFINARFVKPLDTELLDELCINHKKIITIEEGIKRGGYGEAITNYIASHHNNTTVKNIAIDDIFVKQGSVEHLREKLGLDYKSIYKEILSEEK